MRYLVYDTQQAAQEGCDTIFAFGAAVAREAGYDVEADGIIAKVAGVSDPSRKSSRWDTPRQRSDGKWIVAHPDRHALWADPDLAAGLMTRLGDVVVEEMQEDWFPET